MRQVVAVAAKAPLPGRVKTRLVPDLTPEQAAELSACFLRDTLELVESVGRADICVSYQPSSAERQMRELFGDRYRLFPQRGRDLGERLHNALKDLLTAGYEAASVIGSDSPNLPGEYLETAFNALGREGDRIVLGPASDGGYYLIGLKTLHANLFQGIEWSSRYVLERTLEKTRALELEVALLPEWYDVDTVADLERLKADLTLHGAGSFAASECITRHTRQYLMAMQCRRAI